MIYQGFLARHTVIEMRFLKTIGRAFIDTCKPKKPITTLLYGKMYAQGVAISGSNAWRNVTSFSTLLAMPVRGYAYIMQLSAS